MDLDLAAMTGSLFSPSWHRVAGIKPRLRSHVQIHRRFYRSLEWYLLEDPATGRFHRFSVRAYSLIGRMDGEKTLGQIWEEVCQASEEDIPSQDEVISLLSKLYQADALQTDRLPEAGELAGRAVQDRRRKLFRLLVSPTSIKIPVWDPDGFLNRTRNIAQWIFSPWGLWVWLGVVVPALGMAVIQWQSITRDVTVQVLALENLALIGCIYPFLKLIHEFSHAYAVKRWGGEVHDMGLMFLVFVPIPYVDASSATGFEDKKQRMLTGAAGILAEVFVAALAFWVWHYASGGAARAVAFNVMIIAGVSTLVFNGNPLLRFDAYYILSDFLEMPNLAIRANQYAGYLARRYLAGIRDAVSPAEGPGEPLRLGLYAVLSFFYRIFLTLRILLWMMAGLPVVGVLLALWSGITFLVLPVARLIRSLTTDPALATRRGRILSLAWGGSAILGVFLLLIPLPGSTVVQGVAWPPDGAKIYSGSPGFVQGVYAKPGQEVKKGEILLECENEELKTEALVLKGRLKELDAQRMQITLEDRNRARILEDEITKVREELLRARDRIEDLVVRSPSDGVVVLPRFQDLPGRYLRRGEALGFVLAPSLMAVRLVAPQSAIQDLVSHTRKVSLKTAGRRDQTLEARVRRFSPAASRDLPGLALSVEGGGDYALDPRKTHKPQVMEPLFQVELEPVKPLKAGIGERVYVRFHRESEPLAHRMFRGLRRALLRELSF